MPRTLVFANENGESWPSKDQMQCMIETSSGSGESQLFFPKLGRESAKNSYFIHGKPPCLDHFPWEAPRFPYICIPTNIYIYIYIYTYIHIIGVRKIEQEKRFAGCYTMDHFAISSPMASMASNVGKYQDPGHTEASLRWHQLSCCLSPGADGEERSTHFSCFSIM